MSELPATITEAAAWLRDGRITALRLTEACLERCHAWQGTLGAFITICDASARDAARRADDELARGHDRGPLHGIPLGVKDNIATADAPTTASSRVIEPSWGAGVDATVVRKLRQAGAVIVGKLTLHEFACGWPDPATGFPIARNPWDLARTPGGSSSGTAAAVAAGLVLGGLGTDTGGSIRRPAAYCGLSGLRPTLGRVSNDGCVPLTYSMDTIGPMARTARDCALITQAIAGHDPADPGSVDLPVPDLVAALESPLAGVRIGLPRDDFFLGNDALDSDVKDAVTTAVERLAAAGAEVVDVHLPHAHEAHAAFRVILLAEAYAIHEEYLRRCATLYGRHTRELIQQGASLSAAQYVRAQRARAALRADCVAALAAVDVVVTPTMAATAPRFDDWNPQAAAPSFTSVWSLAGFPALNVCCGFSSAGLPIGMQIVGKPFDETTVLAVGARYQELTDWHRHRPPLDQHLLRR